MAAVKQKRAKVRQRGGPTKPMRFWRANPNGVSVAPTTAGRTRQREAVAPTTSEARRTKTRKAERETAIQEVVNYYFHTKGLTLDEIKKNARKKKIIYSRFVRPAKQLLTLAGSIEKAKEALKKVAEWAQSRGLDYSIETTFKKWLELDRLKPKEIVKKPFYHELPMVWSQAHRKWYVISESDEWLEFAGEESEIEWRMIK